MAKVTTSGEYLNKKYSFASIRARTDLLLTHWFTRATSLKSYLIGLILFGLGPLLIFAVVMMVLFTVQEQTKRRRGLQDTARSLTLAVDQEIRASINHLEGLATSEPLGYGAMDSFRNTVARILRTRGSWQR